MSGHHVPSHRATTTMPPPGQGTSYLVPASHISHRFKFTFKTEAQLMADSPSLKDGLAPEKERCWRRQYTGIIHDLGQRLEIPMWGIASAVMFCHRFFAAKSMTTNDRYVVAIACLFLAAKVEESPRRIQKFVEESERLLEGSRLSADAMLLRLADKERLEQRKEEILMAERSVLYTLGFQLNLSTPYKYLLEKMRALDLLNAAPGYQRLLQDTWNLLNDSLRTTLSLQYHPEKLAYAALYLATHMNQKELPIPRNDFFAFFNISRQDVQEISDKLAQLYDDSWRHTHEAEAGCAAAHPHPDELPDAGKGRVEMGDTRHEQEGGSAPRSSKKRVSDGGLEPDKKEARLHQALATSVSG